jgi:hypothetical protein
MKTETIRSKKKGSFYISSLFLCRIREEKMFESEIRDGKMFGSVPGSGIKHPRSATIVAGNEKGQINNQWT